MSRTRGLGLVVALLAGCGSAGQGYSLDVGGDDAGGMISLGAPGADGGGGTLSVSVGSTAAVVCPGGCATLTAQASGGTGPYTYSWDHGLAADGGGVRVCPGATTTYEVTATDSSGKPGEALKANATGSARTTVMVSTNCSDADVPIQDAACASIGQAPPEAGHYVGTVSCGAGSMWASYGPGDGGTTVTPEGGGGMLGTFALDLAYDASGQPSGTWSFQWNLLVIAGAGSLQASLVCDGSEVDGTFANANWGLPGGGMSVVPTGPLTGGLTVARVPGMPGAVAESSRTRRTSPRAPARAGTCVSGR